MICGRVSPQYDNIPHPHHSVHHPLILKIVRVLLWVGFKKYFMLVFSFISHQLKFCLCRRQKKTIQALNQML